MPDQASIMNKKTALQEFTERHNAIGTTTNNTPKPKVRIKLPLISQWADYLAWVVNSDYTKTGLTAQALAQALEDLKQAMIALMNYADAAIRDGDTFAGQMINEDPTLTNLLNYLSLSDGDESEIYNIENLIKPGIYRVGKKFGEITLEGNVPPIMTTNSTGYLMVFNLADDSKERDISGRIRLRQTYYPDNADDGCPMTRVNYDGEWSPWEMLGGGLRRVVINANTPGVAPNTTAQFNVMHESFGGYTLNLPIASLTPVGTKIGLEQYAGTGKVVCDNCEQITAPVPAQQIDYPVNPDTSDIKALISDIVQCTVRKSVDIDYDGIVRNQAKLKTLYDYIVGNKGYIFPNINKPSNDPNPDFTKLVHVNLSDSRVVNFLNTLYDSNTLATDPVQIGYARAYYKPNDSNFFKLRFSGGGAAKDALSKYLTDNGDPSTPWLVLEYKPEGGLALRNYYRKVNDNWCMAYSAWCTADSAYTSPSNQYAPSIPGGLTVVDVATMYPTGGNQGIWGYAKRRSTYAWDGSSLIQNTTGQSSYPELVKFVSLDDLITIVNGSTNPMSQTSLGVNDVYDVPYVILSAPNEDLLFRAIYGQNDTRWDYSTQSPASTDERWMRYGWSLPVLIAHYLFIRGETVTSEDKLALFLSFIVGVNDPTNFHVGEASVIPRIRVNRTFSSSGTIVTSLDAIGLAIDCVSRYFNEQVTEQEIVSWLETVMRNVPVIGNAQSYLFECCLAEDGITREWVMDYEHNEAATLADHTGRLIDLENRRTRSVKHLYKDVDDANSSQEVVCIDASDNYYDNNIDKFDLVCDVSTKTNNRVVLSLPTITEIKYAGAFVELCIHNSGNNLLTVKVLLGSDNMDLLAAPGIYVYRFVVVQNAADSVAWTLDTYQ